MLSHINTKHKSNFILYNSFKYNYFCVQAYKLGMYGKKYVWLIPGYFAEKWWQVADNEVTCTPDELKRASEGYLTVTWSMFGREELPTIAGVVRRKQTVKESYGTCG